MADREITEDTHEVENSVEAVDFHESSHVKEDDENLTKTHAELVGGIEEAATDESEETPKTFPQRVRSCCCCEVT